MPSSGGFLIDDQGEMQIRRVANTYTPLATDRFVNGSLVANDGTLYTTIGAVVADSPYINGVRHTPQGVRYERNLGSTPYYCNAAFNVLANGEQSMSTALGLPVGFKAGILIGNDAVAAGGRLSGGVMSTDLT